MFFTMTKMPNLTNLMPLGDHLEELRRRILIGLMGLIPIVAIALYFGDRILGFVVAPVKAALKAGAQGNLQATETLETFGAYMKLSFLAAILVGSPWILFQLWCFISPGLYRHERRFVYFLLPLSVVLTISGVVFLYFIIMPILLAFFVGFGGDIAPPTIHIVVPAADAAALPMLPLLAGDPPNELLRPGMSWVNTELKSLRVVIATPEGKPPMILSSMLQVESGIQQQYRLGSYVSLVLSMSLAFAIAFQAPVIVLLLGWLNLIDDAFIKKYRKHVVFICAIIAAIATPGDVASMLLLWGPLYLLFELGVVLLKFFPARVVAGKREEPALEEGLDDSP
jgi:sec-independent protein translocase protein TatC